MKRLQTTVKMSRRFNLGDYNGVEITIEEVIEYQEGDNPETVKDVAREGIRTQFRKEALLYPQIVAGQTQLLIAGVPSDMTVEQLLKIQAQAIIEAQERH